MAAAGLLPAAVYCRLLDVSRRACGVTNVFKDYVDTVNETSYKESGPVNPPLLLASLI